MFVRLKWVVTPKYPEHCSDLLKICKSMIHQGLVDQVAKCIHAVECVCAPETIIVQPTVITLS